MKHTKKAVLSNLHGKLVLNEYRGCAKLDLLNILFSACSSLIKASTKNHLNSQKAKKCD